MDKHEALTVIRKNYPHVASSGSYFETALRELIPELKESEDERVRQDIIAVIQWAECFNASSVTHEAAEIMLAWLEKQKEYPTNEEMLRTLRVEYEKGVADTIAKYEQKEQKFTEKQDYSDLTDPERAIHRGFLVVGVENVPVTIIKETAQDCLAQMKPQKEANGNEKEIPNEQKSAGWSEDWREEDVQTRFAFYTYKDDPSVLYLSNVFVEETSRNHGFGTRILRAAEKVAEAIGATTISLKVKQNSPANAWYRKNGYGYVAFEDGYDWLEKNLEYMKPNKQEWSEEEEIKNYLKDNLRMEWEYHSDGNYYMVLKVAGEKICQLNFGEGY